MPYERTKRLQVTDLNVALSHATTKPRTLNPYLRL